MGEFFMAGVHLALGLIGFVVIIAAALTVLWLLGLGCLIVTDTVRKWRR